MKFLAKKAVGGDPDFSIIKTDKKLSGDAGLLPIGVNHTLALFDVMEQVDNGQVPGTDKMDKAGREGFKKKLMEDYLKDMGSYGFDAKSAAQIYYDAKSGYKSKQMVGKVKEGIEWGKSMGVGASNDEQRAKSRNVLLYRNFATGSDNYSINDGIMGNENPQVTGIRKMFAQYINNK
jgi:hypothetical protein